MADSYIITMNMSQLAEHRADPSAALMHELGHVLARELNIGQHAEGEFNFAPSNNIVPREIEAWDMAEKLFHNLREYALKLYHQEHGGRFEIKA